MRTSSLESLSMMTSTLLASWSVDISRVCEVCCANLPEPISRSLMISPRRLFCALTKTSAAFAAKHAFPPGFIGLPIIVSGRTRGVAKTWSGLMKRNGKQSSIRGPSILV